MCCLQKIGAVKEQSSNLVDRPSKNEGCFETYFQSDWGKLRNFENHFNNLLDCQTKKGENRDLMVC